MNIGEILQIVTIGFSVIALVTNTMFEFAYDRKNRRVKVLLTERLENNDREIECFEKLYAITSISVASSYKNSPECINFEKTYLYKLNYFCNSLCAIFIPFFKQEKEMVFIINELKDKLTEFYNSKDQNKELENEIENLRKTLLKKFTVYRMAMEDYLNEQISGGKYTTKSFDLFYENMVQKAEQSSSNNSDQVVELYNTFYEDYKKVMDEIKQEGIVEE